MENFTLGMDCKLYFGDALLNGTTSTPETMTWTEADNAQNVTLGGSTGSADITTRASGKWKQSASTHKDASIDGELLWKPGDTFFEAVKDAWLDNTELPLAAMDGDIEDDGVQGLVSNFVVTNFSRSESLEEAAKVSVSFKPSSYTDWYEVDKAAALITVPAYDVLMTAGTGSIDLTVCGANGTVNLAGKKIVTLRVTALAGNANAITVAEGAVTGYAPIDSYSVVLAAGEQAQVKPSEAAAPDVDSTHKILDVTGTLAQGVTVLIQAR